jgi:hypothetical protein
LLDWAVLRRLRRLGLTQARWCRQGACMQESQDVCGKVA